MPPLYFPFADEMEMSRVTFDKPSWQLKRTGEREGYVLAQMIEARTGEGR
jgi:hypothetical protein